MRILNWYIFLMRGYMYRIRCERWYMDELYNQGVLDEYRQCQSKEKAIELCYIYNYKHYRRRFEDEKI